MLAVPFSSTCCEHRLFAVLGVSSEPRRAANSAGLRVGPAWPPSRGAAITVFRCWFDTPQALSQTRGAFPPLSCWPPAERATCRTQRRSGAAGIPTVRDLAWCTGSPAALGFYLDGKACVAEQPLGVAQVGDNDRDAVAAIERVDRRVAAERIGKERLDVACHGDLVGM
jgi:hypothetical protein